MLKLPVVVYALCNVTKHFYHTLGGAIPDAAMIHAARKRRQMAREMGDFIPVDNTDQYKSNNSRLIRYDCVYTHSEHIKYLMLLLKCDFRDDDNDRSDDDDDDDEDDDGGGRISFTISTAAREREKVREAFLSANDQREFTGRFISPFHNICGTR